MIKPFLIFLLSWQPSHSCFHFSVKHSYQNYQAPNCPIFSDWVNILVLSLRTLHLRLSHLHSTSKCHYHMVKCHKNAYSPKNLSLFAFNIEGYWGLIKKKLKKIKSQMFLSMSLHLWKCFVLLQGVQKICQIIVLFSSQYWVKLSPKKDNHELLRLKKENNNSIIFWTPCKKLNICRGAKT